MYRQNKRASRTRPTMLSSNKDAWVSKSLIKESKGKPGGQIAEKGLASFERLKKGSCLEDEAAMVEAQAKMAAVSRYALRLEQYPSSPAQAVEIPTTPKQPFLPQERR